MNSYLQTFFCQGSEGKDVIFPGGLLKPVSVESLASVLDPLISGLPSLGERLQTKEVGKISKREVAFVDKGRSGKRCVKQKWNQVNFVLGDDIEMHQLVGLSSLLLEGFMVDLSIGVQCLKVWLKEEWESMRERSSSLPVWVKLPGLPLDFWSNEVFKEIGNSLGSFIEVDMSLVDTNAMSVVRILVSFDLREGLGDNILIQKGELVHNQVLDYVKIPFRCGRCHNLASEEKILVDFSLKEEGACTRVPTISLEVGDEALQQTPRFSLSHKEAPCSKAMQEGVSSSLKSKESDSQLIHHPFLDKLSVNKLFFNQQIGDSQGFDLGECHDDEGGSIYEGNSRYLPKPRAKDVCASITEVEGDSVGCAESVLLGWRRRAFHCSNTLSIESGLGVVLFAQALAEELFILNIYGPYADMVAYWISSSLRTSLVIPIIPQSSWRLDFSRRKPPSPFKFNYAWLEEEDFVHIVTDKWVRYDGSLGESACIQCATNLKRLKQAASWWAHQKKLKDELDLVTIERLYKEENRASITEVSKMTSYFPSFVGEEDNGCLLEEVTKFKFQEGIVRGQKDSSRRDASKLREILDLYSSAIDFKDGLKYLGFSLKPNAYGVKDWSWLIAKGVLEKLSFKFLWSGNREKEGIPLVKSQVVAAPKASGGNGNLLMPLGLRGREEEEWELYISSLKRSHVRIKEDGDALLWSKSLASGIYSPKGGYKALCKVDRLEEPQWWWFDIWKFNAL
eukprot:Gb_14385 [translate_table: standard]